MTQAWQKHFPFPTIRDGQEPVIDQIIQNFENGCRINILDAPTGTGKSGIGLTIARHFGSGYYITAQKILQNQLTNDFGPDGTWVGGGSPLVELKGRNAYPCNFYSRALSDPEYSKRIIDDGKKQRFEEMAMSGVNCAKGECKRTLKPRLKFCDNHCPYYNQLDKAMSSELTMMNFHSFIYQTEMVPERWDKRSLLIIDECHNTEQVLMDYVSLSLNDREFNVTFPVYESATEYLIFLEEHNVLDMIILKIQEAARVNNDEEEEHWKHQALKYNKFKRALTESDEEWIVKYEKKENYSSIELKPLFIRSFADPLLFDKADNILMMSATVLNPQIFADSLGISKNDYKYVKLENKFPVENRQIYFKPSGSMSYKNKQETIPKMRADVEKLCNEHISDRGIIHTHNFETADYLSKNCMKSVSRRFFFQNDYPNKQDMLRQHAESKNGIIIAPAMHEGLDLKDDLSRFQIITKVPYPSTANNPQLERRMRISNDYYMYLAALKLVQSYGRSIRSEKDHAKTYVLDSDFKAFCSRAKSILPPWFLEAIVWT